jgi:hypothetical protein
MFGDSLSEHQSVWCSGGEFTSPGGGVKPPLHSLSWPHGCCASPDRQVDLYLRSAGLGVAVGLSLVGL